ncbi:putative mitogen-activated protein kinase kinase kinase 7-like [Amphiura filiformis]|uniref:putative mitogen-activated protein kinase kinase kinase 7-like n=1 Tax=Amphiura filiformis TaxID=82378 RepID=UPI003B226FDD
MATALPNIDKIDYTNCTFHENIGEGAFGSVNRVSFKIPYKGYKEAAGKTVFKLDETEVQIMSQLQHRHIVKLIGFSQTGPIHVILMEYAPNGSLHDYLSDSSKPLPNELKQKWATESALAIQYLHEQNYLHRDIKPSNCLLFESNLLKLCDFGLARKLDHSETTSTQKGTCRYMAPEIHVGNEEGRAIFSKPADIYAYGMLILEICTRTPPFRTWEWHKVVFEVGGGAKPDVPQDCPRHLSHIMQQCWKTDPKQRPTIASVVSDLRNTTEEIRMALFGRTGAGKSATGNSILMKRVFHAAIHSARSVTVSCQLGIDRVFDKTLSIVDTPGLFDTEKKNLDTIRELARAMLLLQPGPHAIILVQRIGRMTPEERHTIDLLLEVFGTDAFKVGQGSSDFDT